MKMSEMFPSKYLTAADLQGKQRRLTIKTIEREDLGEQTKSVIYFSQTKKGLVLNKTNGSEIADSYGDESDGWIGRDITLSPARVPFQGKMVDAIRVSIPAAPIEKSRVAKPKHDERNPPDYDQAPQHTLANELDDEIPFAPEFR